MENKIYSLVDFKKIYPNCKQPETCHYSHSSKCICPKETNISLRELVSMDFSKSLEKTPYCVKQNKDELRGISNWRFQTETEALLAASLWLNIPEEKRNVNEFKYQFKHTLLILGVTESGWLT